MFRLFCFTTFILLSEKHEHRNLSKNVFAVNTSLSKFIMVIFQLNTIFVKILKPLISHLPASHFQKHWKGKILHVTRDPRAVVCSAFAFLGQMPFFEVTLNFPKTFLVNNS